MTALRCRLPLTATTAAPPPLAPRNSPHVPGPARVRDLTKLFGPGCDDCLERTWPSRETNTCNTCGTLVACADVSFDLRPGHTLGIVGESGSGKTTVLRCLYGDLDAHPRHGPPGRLPGRAALDLRGQLSRAADPQLHPRDGLPARLGGPEPSDHAGGNVAERLLAAEWRRIGQIRERAATLLGRMEVPITRMDDFGPLQRRHAAARPDRQGARQRPGRGAAGRDDEWTGRLGPGRPRPGPGDPARRGRGDGRRLHDLGVVRLLCERTIVMKNGRVVEAGLTDQILEDPHHPYTQLLVSSIN